MGGNPIIYYDPSGLVSLCTFLKQLGDFEIQLDAAVGAGIALSGGITLSSSGIEGTVTVGVGGGISGNASAGASVSGNVGSTGKMTNVQAGTTVGGGGGPVGASGTINAGTDGVNASASAGVGIGWSVVSGIGISGEILDCKEEACEK